MPLRCAVVYECGTKDLQVSDYMDGDTAIWVARFILRSAAARQSARNPLRRGSLRGNPPASVQQLEMRYHSVGNLTFVKFENGPRYSPRSEALSNMCIIYVLRRTQGRGIRSRNSARKCTGAMRAAAGDLAGRTASIWVYAQLERSRTVR